MIDPNQYIIEIPSYKRSHSIGNHTLRVLHEKGVDPQKIFIFV